ncbi:alkane hydroxylase mah1 [Phtheirospermum japonicum]|uniref:Alkane hydroxylase mah1 n=1 Tax=Phtheirospermum japonicum TaxID=374723 RepID=A0A830BIU7_9LAMI|nr:alkane hydroxylase mah1 [Phtheirospermum japonicum]
MSTFPYPSALFFIAIPLIITLYILYKMSRRNKKTVRADQLASARDATRCSPEHASGPRIRNRGFRPVWRHVPVQRPLVLQHRHVVHMRSRKYPSYFQQEFLELPKRPRVQENLRNPGRRDFQRRFRVMGSSSEDNSFPADTCRLLELPGEDCMGQGEHGLLPVLDNFSQQGAEFDLQDIFQRFMFDNICKLALDYDPCSLCLDLPYVACDKAFNYAAEPLLHRHIIPETIWRLQKWLRIGNERILSEARRAFDEFIYPRVELKSVDEGDDDFRVLRAFKKVYKEKNIGSSGDLRDFLRDTALSLMLAGRDTTSTCLTWLFWLVARNPSKETKILEEVETVLNLKEDGVFNVEESKKLIYLHGALCESLRLFPPVALEHKTPTRPDYLPSGVNLKRHTKIIVSFFSVGRMEAVWGKDCLEFKPERWISPSGGIKHEPSYKFPAFNVGPRTCLGKEMAFIQMKMVAATILYRYNVRLVEGHVVTPRDSIILQARNGLRVRLSKRIV